MTLLTRIKNAKGESDLEMQFLNIEEAPPEPDELAAIEAYKAGDPEYQPYISQEELMKELGL